MAWVNGSGSTPGIMYIHTELEPDWLLHMYVRMYVCMYVCRRLLLYHEIEINNGIHAAIAPSTCGTSGQPEDHKMATW